MSSADIQREQDDIAAEFAMFGDWSERYQYLIDLAKALPVFPESLKLEENLLKGCQSQVYVHIDGDQRQLNIQAISDSAIVSGLIALTLRVYNQRSAEEILATPPSFIDAIGLAKNLSMTRKNGLNALIDKIRAEARLRLGAG
jgi:cysteine desulfuration protein SufE